jgi:hypothetical protein
MMAVEYAGPVSFETYGISVSSVSTSPAQGPLHTSQDEELLLACVHAASNVIAVGPGLTQRINFHGSALIDARAPTAGMYSYSATTDAPGFISMFGSFRTAPRPDGGIAGADAGAPDAGVPDAGAMMADAGAVVPDAGAMVPDAGVMVPDAGATVPDAGHSVGPPIDAGVRDPSPIGASSAQLSIGCGCTSAGEAFAMLAAALVLFRARRARGN